MLVETIKSLRITSVTTNMMMLAVVGGSDDDLCSVCEYVYAYVHA